MKGSTGLTFVDEETKKASSILKYGTSAVSSVRLIYYYTYRWRDDLTFKELQFLTQDKWKHLVRTV